jgi:hypothetical protein
MNLPTEILYTILSYSDDIRILKIKMNKNNIKYLFELDRQICDYLYSKTSSFTPCLGEGLYLTLINILNDESIKIENVFDTLLNHIKKWNSNIDYYDYNWYNSMLDIVISDYNDLYLNDKYYYDGYWYDGRWISRDVNELI